MWIATRYLIFLNLMYGVYTFECPFACAGTQNSKFCNFTLFKVYERLEFFFVFTEVQYHERGTVRTIYLNLIV